MRTWKYWQDWAALIPGLLLLITPFVFGVATIGSHSWSAWIFGAVIGVVAVALALLWLGFPSNRLTETTTIIVGTALFISPWILGFTAFTVDMWALCIVGVLLVLVAGGLAVENWSRQTGLPTYRLLYQNTKTSRGYRRLSNPL